MYNLWPLSVLLMFVYDSRGTRDLITWTGIVTTEKNWREMCNVFVCRSRINLFNWVATVVVCSTLLVNPLIPNTLTSRQSNHPVPGFIRLDYLFIPWQIRIYISVAGFSVRFLPVQRLCFIKGHTKFKVIVSILWWLWYIQN